jgi:Ca2+-transporting ATPase
MHDWYRLPPDQALAKLQSDRQSGLSALAVEARRRSVGNNEFIERGQRGALAILWQQFSSTMILILIAAALLSALVGGYKDTLAIGTIVILFALIGFVQEYRAGQAMAALKKMALPQVRVLHEGRLQEVSARDLVPGDIVQLETGNLVPADCYLLECVNLRVQEAALTGESVPVEKQVAHIAGETALAERRNMAYMGTLVAVGRATALVVETGMRTELGRIADLMQAVPPGQTPLQRRLDHLGRMLALVGVAVALLVVVPGLLRGDAVVAMLLIGVSVIVAIVPEGLPAVVTITLALGARRMLKRHVLIRQLPAVETLGSVTVICSDKTGTLTENRMTVQVLHVLDHLQELPSTEPAANPDIGFANPAANHAANPAANHAAKFVPLPAPFDLLLIGGALCNDAQWQAGAAQALGDPTETALLVAAARYGWHKRELEPALPRRAELPFDSTRKRMSTIHAINRGSLPPQLLAQLRLAASLDEGDDATNDAMLMLTKGAADGLLTCASRVWHQNRVVALEPELRQRLQLAADQFAAKGMRVLGLALRCLPAGDELPNGIDAARVEQDLIFIGLFGMIDPPRVQAKAAVQKCTLAGIRTVMITGDHPLTALHIAAQLGIETAGGVLSGQEIDAMHEGEDNPQLQARVPSVSVYARVSPEHKLRIVRALQQQGQIVAMTGDGVNDAPALRQADIGVAMGQSGTDVAKQAADMVLLDDDFSTIVAAVEEGRVIYDNVRKFVLFSVAGNLAKVAVMLTGPMLGMPLPLLALQLLWLNLLTDGLLGLGLGLEAGERNIMRRPPWSPTESVFSRGAGVNIVWLGVLMGVLAIGAALWFFRGGQAQWQTVLFTMLALVQVWQALASASSSDSFFAHPLRNKLLLGLVSAVVGLQLAVIYLPPMQDFFKTRALSLADLGFCVVWSSLVFWAVEGKKWLVRKREQKGEGG